MTPEPSTIMINDQLSSSSNASSATASPSTPLSSTTVTTATASMNDNNNNNNHSNNHEPWISTISTSMANYHPQQQLSNHLRSQLTNNSGYSSSSPPRQPPPSTLSLMNKSLNDQEKGFNKDNSPATSSMTEMLQQALTISTICNYRQRFERLLLLIIFIVCTLCIILLVLMIVILINQRYLNEKTINNDNNNQNNEQNYWKQLQSSLSSYPHPQLLPGYYHYYYSINNGINHPLNVPLLMANNDQNQSSSSSSLSESNTNNDNHTMIEQPKQSSMNQNPLKFYQNFIPTPPMGPIFSALQLLSARNSNNNANDDYYKRIAAMINKQPEQLKSTFISPDYTNQDSRTVCLSSGCVKAAI